MRGSGDRVVGLYLKVPALVKFFCVVGASGSEEILVRVVIERGRKWSKGRKKQEGQKKVQHVE